jgi:hypothetical protein
VIANTSFENAAKFKYFEMTVTNQNRVCEENQRRLNSGNVGTIEFGVFSLPFSSLRTSR